MFTKKRLLKTAILVFIISAVTFALTCSSEPTPTGQGYKFLDPAIEGHVFDSSHMPVEDAYVEWWCEECDPDVFLDDDYTNSLGEYDVGGDIFEDHDGHDITGYASKPGLGNGKLEIPDYDSTRLYRNQDFTLL